MFEEYLELYVGHLASNNKSEQTITQYEAELRRFIKFLGDKQVNTFHDIETFHIDMYQAKLMKVNKSTSVKKKISILRTFFKYMVSRKYLKESPIASIETIRVKDSDKKKKENLTVEEALKLIEKTEKNSIPSMRLRNKVLMMAFLFFGLRVSELCSLRTEDVSFKNKTIYIFDGKGGKNREVPLFDELIPDIKEYLRNKKVKSEYFFTKKQTNKPLKPRAVLDLVKRHTVKAKIRKNIGCHSLRRTTATLLLEDGFDPRKIQLFLGHSSINTTMLYLNPDLEETKDQIRKGYSLAKKLKRQNKKQN